MNPSQTILDNIRYIVRGLRVSSRAAEVSCGLSSAQLFVLRALDGDEGISVNDLAARTLTHQSSVSVVVKRLVEQGLVIKRASKEDSRARKLTLSPKGRSKLSKSPPLIQERLLEALSDFNDTDLDLLARLLSELVQKAELGEGTAPLFDDETRNKRKS